MGRLDFAKREIIFSDALGCPVEGWRDGTITELFGSLTTLPDEYPLEEINSRLGFRVLKRLRPLGLHSDDTQQALALLNCCLHNGKKWNVNLWVKWLVQGMEQQAWRGFGKGFATAVSNLSKGIKPQQSGNPSTGIGASMRVGPLGALYRNDLEMLSTVVYESSFVTHSPIVSGTIAFAIAYTVRCFILGDTASDIRSKLPDIVKAQEEKWLNQTTWKIDKSLGHLISDSLRRIFEQIDKCVSVKKLREFISENAKPHLPPNKFKSHPNQGFVLLGATHALAMGLLPDVDPKEMLGDIISLGYDTDTVAAMAGSIFGARFGTNWIPKNKLLDIDRLETYANALIELEPMIETRSEFFAREVEWALLSDQMRKDLVKQFYPQKVEAATEAKLRRQEKIAKRNSDRSKSHAKPPRFLSDNFVLYYSVL